MIPSLKIFRWHKKCSNSTHSGFKPNKLTHTIPLMIQYRTLYLRGKQTQQRIKWCEYFLKYIFLDFYSKSLPSLQPLYLYHSVKYDQKICLCKVRPEAVHNLNLDQNSEWEAPDDCCSGERHRKSFTVREVNSDNCGGGTHRAIPPCFFIHEYSKWWGIERATVKELNSLGPRARASE